MGKHILFVEIFQPFAQYRNPFTFYYAQTFPLPPKSTVIGMLQNATNRYYDPEFWDLKVSIHGGFESTFWNYQQLIKGEITIGKVGVLVNYHKDNISTKLATWLPLYKVNKLSLTSRRSPTFQQELFNGYLFIFMKGKKELIVEIKEALENPKKVLSLGRSEDVIFIRNVKLLEEEPQRKKVKKSLWLTYPTYIKLKGFPIKNEKFPVYSIPERVEFKNNGKPISNKAELRKDTERVVEFIPVIFTSYDYVIYLKEEIEVEKYKIGEKLFKIPKDFGWL